MTQLTTHVCSLALQANCTIKFTAVLNNIHHTVGMSWSKYTRSSAEWCWQTCTMPC